jgi:hypothetical protein
MTNISAQKQCFYVINFNFFGNLKSFFKQSFYLELLLDGVVEVVGPDVVEGDAEAVAFDLGLLSVGRLIAEDGNDNLHNV